MIFPTISINFLFSLGLLFILVFLSSLGLPGGIISLISAGAFANNIFELILIMIIGIVAAISGDYSAYLLAEKFSSKLSPRLNKWTLFRDNEIKVRKKLDSSWFYIIFVSRFLLTELCAVISYISGFIRIGKKKFLIAVISGEILYGIIYVLIGFLFKAVWNEITTVITNAMTIIVLIIITALILYILKKVLSKKD
jgi:membrane protein DedA with SNARE-associated domain